MNIYKKAVIALASISIVFIAILISVGNIINTNDIKIIGMSGQNFYLMLLVLLEAIVVSFIYSLISYFNNRNKKVKRLHNQMIELYDNTNKLSKECNSIKEIIKEKQDYTEIEERHNLIKKYKNNIEKINYDLSKQEIKLFFNHTNLKNAIDAGINTYSYITDCIDSMEYLLISLNSFKEIDREISIQKKLTSDIELFLKKKSLIIENLDDVALKTFCNSERIKMLSYETLNTLYIYNKVYDGIGDIENFEKEYKEPEYELSIDKNKFYETMKSVNRSLKKLESDSSNMFSNGIYYYEQISNELKAFINESLLVLKKDDLLLSKVIYIDSKFDEILDTINMLLTKKENYLSTMMNEVSIEDKMNYINNIKEIKLINSISYSVQNYIEENRILNKIKED